MSTPNKVTAEVAGENELEKLLRLASSESVHRPAFFSTLLEATVWVLGDDEQINEQGESTLASGDSVNLQHWEKQDGSSIIPFFSSLEVLEKAVDREVAFIAMPARTLFEMTQGSELYLNPKADYGKEFLPQEVAMLLENGGVAKPTELVVDKETQLLIGQPEVYPAAMVDALTRLYSQHKPMRRAFLALIHDKKIDEQPNLLVGIEVDGTDAEIDALIQQAGQIASETLDDDAAVDFCIVSEKERGISHYLITHTQPFYQRKWGSWLRNIIPSSGQA